VAASSEYNSFIAPYGDKMLERVQSLASRMSISEKASIDKINIDSSITFGKGDLYYAIHNASISGSINCFLESFPCPLSNTTVKVVEYNCEATIELYDEYDFHHGLGDFVPGNYSAANIEDITGVEPFLWINMELPMPSKYRMHAFYVYPQ
jgi:hypothetical protein